MKTGEIETEIEVHVQSYVLRQISLGTKDLHSQKQRMWVGNSLSAPLCQESEKQGKFQDCNRPGGIFLGF